MPRGRLSGSAEERRRRRADGSTGPARSVARDLAEAYRHLLDEHGAAVAAKATIALVSNQPGDAILLESVAAAAEWVRQQAGPVQRSKLLAALPSGYADVVRQLSDAVGTRLSSAEFCDFLARLDLSQTGALDRATLARAVVWERTSSPLAAARILPGGCLTWSVSRRCQAGIGASRRRMCSPSSRPRSLSTCIPPRPGWLMYPTRCPRQAPAISRRQ